MGYRIDSDTYESLVESVQVGSTSSGANVWNDGTAMAPWMQRPWAGREDRLMSQALELMEVPAEEIRKIKPIIPMTMFPDETIRYDRQSLTIGDALDVDRWKPTMRSWISGPSRAVRRADMQEDVWSGTMRNVSDNPMM